MTTLPSLEPCAHCGHVQGEHRSTAGGGFSLHPVRYGRCLVAGCDCGEWESSSDQSESEAGRLRRELEGVMREHRLLAVQRDELLDALRDIAAMDPADGHVQRDTAQRAIVAFDERQP